MGRLGVNLGRKNEKKLQKDVTKISKNFYTTIEQKLIYPPSLKAKLYFASMKSLIYYVFREDPEYSLDFQYWRDKGWFEKDYYYDTKIGIGAKFIGNRIERAISKNAGGVKEK